MKTEIKITAAIGKTLSAVDWGDNDSGQFVLAFADGTFATLGIDRGYDIGDEEIKEDTLDVLRFGDQALARAGIATLAEMQAMREDLRQKDRAAEIARRVQVENSERAEFERLRRKFGGA